MRVARKHPLSIRREFLSSTLSTLVVRSLARTLAPFLPIEARTRARKIPRRYDVARTAPPLPATFVVGVVATRFIVRPAAFRAPPVLNP
jgi:hypothetical protein